jgi:hypothetical protein
MFEEDARIFLNGCNIAESECSTGTCGPRANGRKFLVDMARVFLRKNGGRVGASTSKGIPFFDGKVYHLWGETVYALISRGSGAIRIVAGDELLSPVGNWRVTLDDGSVELYWFTEKGKVGWSETGKAFGAESGEGTWKKSPGKIQIAWNSGGREDWVTPLYTREQSGVWTTATGRTSDIKAEKITGW